MSYEGLFKNGMRHGRGVWREKDVGHGAVYEGEYVLDKKEGQGTYTWVSGNFYKGSFASDLRHGYGEMYWTDGSYYKGNWVDGIQEGEGELRLPDGSVRKGLFRSNEYIGPLEP